MADAVAQRLVAHAQPSAGGVDAQPQRTPVAVEAGEGQPVGFGHEFEACARRVLIFVDAQRLQAFLQAVQRQFADMFDAVAAMHRHRLQRIECRTEAGLAAQVRQQRQQAFLQVGGEIGAIALAPQHPARTREGAGIVVAARTQQAGRPEFDLRRVEQDGLQGCGWGTRHCAQLIGALRAAPMPRRRPRYRRMRCMVLSRCT